ncbi:MAG: carboxypeptidase-like regulatory domain-containing protein [Balneola sp.]
MFNKKTIYIGLFLILFGVVSTASTTIKTQDAPITASEQAVLIEGTVTDSETQMALQGVKVEIADLNVSATTDKNGEFTIEDLKAGEVYELTIEHEGYEDFEKMVDTKTQSPDKEIEVELEPEVK